ncbi:MAG: FAD-dependent oxidoreductase [Actinobacteria bacterium]|nr:MAG: FAD-dependent oxidoreductase [Actinomycetota bacterium]
MTPISPMIPSPFDRRSALARLADEHFDVLVIGGGITGAGVALDAAARGLRTALVERDDFASGTSSKSSKLVHGGLRYLQQKSASACSRTPRTSYTRSRSSSRCSARKASSTRPSCASTATRCGSTT